MISDAQVFEETHMPHRLEHREAEIEQLSRALRPGAGVVLPESVVGVLLEAAGTLQEDIAEENAAELAEVVEVATDRLEEDGEDDG